MRDIKNGKEDTYTTEVILKLLFHARILKSDLTYIIINTIDIPAKKRTKQTLKQRWIVGKTKLLHRK